jgi:hypothetical protein
VEPSIVAMRRPFGYQGVPITPYDALLATMSDELGLPVWTWTVDHHVAVMEVAVWW